MITNNHDCFTCFLGKTVLIFSTTCRGLLNLLEQSLKCETEMQRRLICITYAIMCKGSNCVNSLTIYCMCLWLLADYSCKDFLSH